MLPRRQLLDLQDHYRSSRIQIVRSGAAPMSYQLPETQRQIGGSVRVNQGLLGRSQAVNGWRG